MKHLTKSSTIDYHRIYNVLLLNITVFLLYVLINFFLPYALFISYWFLAIGIFYLLVYFFSKLRLHLVLALSGTILSILLALAFNYF